MKTFKVSKSEFSDFIMGIKIEREDNNIYFSHKHNMHNKRKIKIPYARYSNNANNEPVNEIKKSKVLSVF